LVTGYGLAVIGNTLGQPTFYSTMKLVAVPTAPGYDYTGTIIGAANGTFFGAAFIGCLIAAWMVDFWGRVSTLLIAAILGIIGGAVQGGAANPGMVSYAF
jgi:MFS family permease